MWLYSFIKTAPDKRSRAVLTTALLLLLPIVIAGCSKEREIRTSDLGCVACVLWDRYASFTIRADGRREGEKVQFRYQKHVHDVRIDVTRDRYLAFSVMFIPGAGYFYKNVNSELGCKPDIYEQLDLQAQIVLYVLSQAYPDGPSIHWVNKSFEIAASRHQSGEKEFSVAIGGVSERVIKWSQPWSAQGKMVQLQDSTLSYNMVIKSDSLPNSLIIDQTISGEWRADEDSELIDEQEPLSQWRSCFTGSFDYDEKTGKRLHVSNLENTDSLRTFGDVFKAVKEARFHPLQRREKTGISR